MVQFTRLRLQGFKSFVEKTELEIGAGMNGIVGPNGCGKSNLVEALRWVMGENSAKRMRGGGMEDVIFNGTDNRSARNIAEVSLLLDNSGRTAPAAYNGSDDIEITRRIERDKGSNYRINGKSVRARDVQMFFADSVSGANSPALVSQGRITEIIKAKPLERRLILEDSAGISGLFVRRHEAELKLKAADNNLQRIDDIMGSMQNRLNSLKRQVQQASRYRNLSAQIRQLDITLAALEHAGAHKKIKRAGESFATAESAVAEKLTTVSQLTKTQNTQAQDLPALRKAEAECAAALQAHKVALQRLEDDTRHQTQLRENAQEQLTRLTADQAHEQKNLEETDHLLVQLDAEQETLTQKQSTAEDAVEEKTQQSEALKAQVLALEERYNALMQGVAETRARKASLDNQIAQNERRLETITQRRDNARETLQDLQDGDQDSGLVDSITASISEKEAQAATLKHTLERAQAAITALDKQVEDAGQALDESRQHYKFLTTEITMLEQFLNTQDSSAEYDSVLDQITPQPGFEKALSRALGDTLMASLDAQAPCYWQTVTANSAPPPLPSGAKALVDVVKAPKALHLALSQIGYVENDAQGQALLTALKPGQALVSGPGMYWRWDGLTIKADAADRNATHLEQKNKLQDLRAALPAAEEKLNQCSAQAEALKAQRARTQGTADETAQQIRTLEHDVNAAHIKAAQVKEQRARLDSRIEHLSETLRVAEDDIKTVSDVIRWDKERLEALTHAAQDSAASQADLEAMHSDLLQLRAQAAEAVRAYDMAVQQKNSLRARLQAIGDERVNAKNRNIRARERLKELAARLDDTHTKLSALQNKPEDNGADKDSLLEKISAAETRRDEAAEALATCERAVYETGRALKEAENALGDAREARALAQATLAAAKEDLTRIETHINEQFNMPPAELRTHVSIEMDTADFHALRKEKEELTMARERMGPVNLRADEEFQELDKEVGAVLAERDDLIAAIDELRGGIQTINVEARERLMNAFHHVNSHFQTLFEQLFAGGKAHLELVGSEDPLEAGLEIFAQPPGKALQSLSLLSGGEQTMTSIALIFGMFLTNPSPICVLDEIDAPLDDANVDRVCNLLETIAARGETRFIIITHHRLTMARMDCLYGVTMQERGVSQLVSVDLQQSFDFVEAA